MKTIKYKCWAIVWNKSTQEYDLYTPTELEQPKGFREVEYSCATIADAQAFIDSY